MTPRRGRTIGALVVAAALLATCGGSGKATVEEYERELRSTMDELESAYGAAGGGGSQAEQPRTVADEVSKLRSSQVAIRDAGNRLAAIEPPAELADSHDDLVAGVRDMADAVDLLVEAQELAASDPARAKQLTREFAADDSFERVEAAAAELSDAGVDAGL